MSPNTYAFFKLVLRKSKPFREKIKAQAIIVCAFFINLRNTKK